MPPDPAIWSSSRPATPDGATPCFWATRAVGVTVLDQVRPRSHLARFPVNMLGHEMTNPAEVLRAAGAEVDRFSSVQTWLMRAKRVVQESDESCEVSANAGETIRARRVETASGETDVLPEIPGTEELWVHNVFHCPYCVAFRLIDQQLAIDSANEEAHMMGTIIAE